MLAYLYLVAFYAFNLAGRYQERFMDLDELVGGQAFLHALKREITDILLIGSMNDDVILQGFYEKNIVIK